MKKKIQKQKTSFSQVFYWVYVVKKKEHGPFCVEFVHMWTCAWEKRNLFKEFEWARKEYSLGGGNSFNERELNLITNALMNFLQLLDIFNSTLTSR